VVSIKKYELQYNSYAIRSIDDKYLLCFIRQIIIINILIMHHVTSKDFGWVFGA